MSDRGINIRGARIDGDVDLDYAPITFPLSADKCAFKGSIRLNFARIRLLRLVSSFIRRLDCNGAQVNGSVSLRESFVTEGQVNFRDATIGGNLECEDAHLLGADLTGNERIALNADGATIIGRVILRNSFVTRGEVRFLGATINGSLECDGAQLSNPQGETLDCDRVKISGRVFLRNGFKSEGMVDFLESTIDGSLECDNAQFLVDLNINPKGRAFRADRARINGNLTFRGSLASGGQVRLVAASITGNLECDGAQFNNSDGRALDANGAKISGIFLRGGFRAIGEVNLILTTIGGNLDCENGRLTNPHGFALNADGAKIGTYARFTNGFDAEGIVNLSGTLIGRSLIYSRVTDGRKTFLDLRAAKVAVLADDESSWPLPGKLLLDGFTYDRIEEQSVLNVQSRLRWLKLQPSDKFFPQPYEQLASVLRTMGHEDEARAVMVEKNRAYAKSIVAPLKQKRWWQIPEKIYGRVSKQEWWWYNLFGWINGYGYKPWRAFFISLGVIALSAMFFQLGYSRGLISPSKENAYVHGVTEETTVPGRARKISDEYPKFNAMAFSLESFTPLLKLDQSASWMPNANRADYLKFSKIRVPFSGSFLRVYLWCHIIAGWVLTSLWIGGLTGLVKT